MFEVEVPTHVLRTDEQRTYSLYQGDHEVKESWRSGSFEGVDLEPSP